MNCHYLTQRNFNTKGQLQGVRCKKEATDGNFCKVHSYDATRFTGAGPGPGYITPVKQPAVSIA